MMRIFTKPPLARPFFESERCPDLFDFAQAEAPKHKAERPLKADTQCGKLAKVLVDGGTFTSLEAIKLTGGTEAPRRIRELRSWLKIHEIRLCDIWEHNETSKWKRYFLPTETERMKLEGLLR
jgi:hypothetical protein